MARRFQQGTAPRTFVGYEAAIERHISPHLGRVRLAKLTPQHLQAWMGTLEGQGVSVGRRRYARVVLRMALNTAIRWRLVTVNAATLIDAPRTTSREIRPLLVWWNVLAPPCDTGSCPAQLFGLMTQRRRRPRYRAV